MPYYKIKGMPGLDGLIVDGSGITTSREGHQIELVVDDGSGAFDVVMVKEIINPNVAIGDSTLKWPIEYGSLFINTHCLEKIDFSPREYATDNPFGKLQYEGHWGKGEIQVDYALYDNVLTVSVRDVSAKPIKTVFTENYFDDFRVDAEECIQQVLRNEQDLEELVFSLQDIASAQKSQKSI